MTVKKKGYIKDENVKTTIISYDQRSLDHDLWFDLDNVDLLKASNEDQIIMDEAIKIASYWKVAQKRFIDNVIMTIDYSMINNILKNKMLRNDLQTRVYTNLTQSTFSEQTIVQILLSEDAEKTCERQSILLRCQKLQKARQELNDVSTLRFVQGHQNA